MKKPISPRAPRPNYHAWPLTTNRAKFALFCFLIACSAFSQSISSGPNSGNLRPLPPAPSFASLTQSASQSVPITSPGVWTIVSLDTQISVSGTETATGSLSENAVLLGEAGAGTYVVDFRASFKHSSTGKPLYRLAVFSGPTTPTLVPSSDIWTQPPKNRWTSVSGTTIASFAAGDLVLLQLLLFSGTAPIDLLGPTLRLHRLK